MRKEAKFEKINIAKIYIARFYPALINPHKVLADNVISKTDVLFLRHIKARWLNFTQALELVLKRWMEQNSEQNTQEH